MRRTYLFEYQYYEYKATEPQSNHRVYQLNTGAGSTYIIPLVCAVHNVGDLKFFAVRRSDDFENEFVLHTDSHDKIMTDGALSPE